MSKVYPLGKYKLNKVGNSYKVSVHPQILEKWGLKKDDDDGESPEVHVYAEYRDGNVIMVASKDPFEGFEWME